MSVPPEPARGDRLDSWKEIAAYLNRGARTVQRWEREMGLPVHRLGHQKQGSVFAFRSELDAWWNSRRTDLEVEKQQPAAPDLSVVMPARTAPGKPAGRNLLRVAALAVVLAVSLLVLWRFAGIGKPNDTPLKTAPLTSYPGNEMWPSFSPDGKQVAFTWNGETRKQAEVYTKPIGAEPPLRLTTGTRSAQHPVWAPDARSIAFLRSSQKARDDVFLVPAQGGPERKIGDLYTSLVSDLPYAYLAWTPDSRWLVAPDKSAAAEPYALVLLSPESGEKRRLTSPPPRSLGDTAPAVSRDGRKLAFLRCPTIRVCGLYVQDLLPDFAAKGEPGRLVKEAAGGIFSPVWTPDGKEILYVVESGGMAGLWRVAATGSHAPQPVTSAGNVGRQIALSPQGDRVAYSNVVANRHVYQFALGSRGKTTGEPLQLTTSTRIDQEAQISPDGRRIVFVSDRSGSTEIWLADADGKNESRLTSFEGPENSAPRWSPDGARIAFDARIGSNADVYVIHAGGGKPVRLTTYPANNCAPTWSRDGKWIYFASDRTGEFQVWKMPAGGGDAVRITKKGGFGGQESLDGKFLYYAKAYGYGDTSLWRVPSGGGEETQVADQLFSRDNFDIAGDGIYFVHSWAGERGHPICFYRFSTGQVEEVGLSQKPVTVGLSVWPHTNPQRLLFAVMERPAGDLLMVENFR